MRGVLHQRGCKPLPTPLHESCQAEICATTKMAAEPRGVGSSVLLANERSLLAAANWKAARAPVPAFQSLCRVPRPGVLRSAVAPWAPENLGPSCWVGLATTTFQPPLVSVRSPGSSLHCLLFRSQCGSALPPAELESATGPRLSWSQSLACGSGR